MNELTKHYMDRRCVARRHVCDSMKPMLNTVLPLGESLSDAPLPWPYPKTNPKAYKQD